MQFLRVCFQNAASDRSIPPKLPMFTGHPKWQCDRSILNAKTKNEFVFRFSYFTFENEKRKTNSFFVFLTSLLKTKNEKGIRFSFANLNTKNEKGIRYPFFVRKFENEKGKNGIYTDRDGSTYRMIFYATVHSNRHRNVIEQHVVNVLSRPFYRVLHEKLFPLKMIAYISLNATNVMHLGPEQSATS